jgi:hypothetical protein
MSPIRKRFGLMWKGPRFTLTDLDRIADAVITVLVVLAVLLLFGWLNARDAQITAEIEADRSSRQFADFLNGGRLVSDDGRFAAKIETLIEVAVK